MTLEQMLRADRELQTPLPARHLTERVMDESLVLLFPTSRVMNTTSSPSPSAKAWPILRVTFATWLRPPCRGRAWRWSLATSVTIDDSDRDSASRPTDCAPLFMPGTTHSPFDRVQMCTSETVCSASWRQEINGNVVDTMVMLPPETVERASVIPPTTKVGVRTFPPTEPLPTAPVVFKPQPHGRPDVSTIDTC
jgi:hypothetical protein